MKRKSPSSHVREPVQVYLDQPDRALLEAVAARTALPRSEVLRVALRRMAAELPDAERPGASISALVGALDAALDVPRDLAAHHDDYLYAPVPSAVGRMRETAAASRAKKKRSRTK
ncbi:MAG TPA: ribbon-helix-helix protein, CopG family [Gemmatimonadaceae bacterium]|nr:ribbon-helix-helix protein, CopG family [Gemmatimonadaceae bacterium]